VKYGPRWTPAPHGHHLFEKLKDKLMER